MYKLLLLVLLSVGAKAQTVYKTPSGKKYHLATCRSVNNVSTAISISEAIALGLEPCKICHPPTLNRSAPAAAIPSGESTATVQCKAMTKAGTRCKHMTKMANGYCWQHNPG